jgi:hypothetical protein
MNSNEHATQLKQFREQVYQNLNKRADAIMDLLDALSGNSQARSVVELSLEACFRREHTSVFKAITAYRPEWMSKSLTQLGAVSLPEPRQRPFWLLGVDTDARAAFVCTNSERSELRLSTCGDPEQQTGDDRALLLGGGVPARARGAAGASVGGSIAQSTSRQYE